MEDQIIIGLVGLVGVYILYRVLSTPQRPSQSEMDTYADVLNDKKYKVKGQWDR